jgi:hypothetical protein
MTRNLVGIGTTDPQYTLDVAGDINVTGGLFSNGQNVSGALYWTETAGENVVTNANVGIGITGEPSERLHVEGNILVKGNVVPAENETYDLGTSTSAFRDLYLSGDTIFLGNTKITSDPVTGSVTFLDKDSNEVKEIVSENTQNISVQDGNTIFESGNVGIGVTNPADKLVVGGNARIDGNLTVNGTQTVINTNVEETSRIEVTNNGTGPAIIVNQIGAQPIANFQDDGVSALFIADGGNVGIGITNPADKLHVQGLGNFVADSSRNMDLTAYIDSSAGGAGFITRFGRGTEASPQAVQSGDVIFGIYSRGRHESAFSTNNVGAIRIRASENFTSLANGTLIDFATTTNGSTSRTTRMTIGNDGNVGIGVTNPGSKLQVNSNISILYPNNNNLSNNGVTIFGPARAGPTLEGTSDLYGTLFINSTDPYERNRGASIAIGGRSNDFGGGEQHQTWARISGVQRPDSDAYGGDLVMETNANGRLIERMRIKTNGNVGIGLTNPVGKLSVFTGLSGTSYNMNTQEPGSISFSNVSNDNAIPCISGKSTSDIGLQIIAGNQDTGIAPAMVFDARQDNNNDFTTFTTPAFQFRRRGNNLMTILRNGNVGIGTTNPQARLRVNGNLRVDSKIEIGTSNLSIELTETQGKIGLTSSSEHTLLTHSIGNVEIAIDSNNNRTDRAFIVSHNAEGGGTELFRVQENGNVGIGTASPSQLLSLGPNGAGFPTPSGAAPLYACRAWVNFNGTGTPSIRASGNVSSVTRSGIGNYFVNFIISMPNTNYCCVSGQETAIGSPASVANQIGFRNYATTNINVTIDNSGNGSFSDKNLLNVAIFL